MSEAIDDGGPAFPFEHRNPAGDDVLMWEEGMSLRDWFAGQALAGIMANDALQDRLRASLGGDELTDAAIAEGFSRPAYLFADHMLIARKESK